MRGLNGRAKRLEQRHGVGGEIDEEARRQRAQEALDAVRARMQRIVEQEGLAPDDLTQEGGEEGGTVRKFYQEVFGVEAGDDEWRAREALCKKYGAVSLAPLSEQRQLRRF